MEFMANTTSPAVKTNHHVGLCRKQKSKYNIENSTTYCTVVSRKPQYKDVYGRTIEMSQRAHIFKVNCCLKAHNAYPK